MTDVVNGAVSNHGENAAPVHGGGKKQAVPRCCLAGGPRDPPEFVEERLKLWDQWKAEREAFVAKQERKPIKITLPDGRIMDGIAWETTPFSIALKISKSLGDSAVISKVNGELWDLERPFEGDANLAILNFEDKDGQYVFWHSSAHILGEAMEQHLKGQLCYGPPVEEGFYYDIWLNDKQVKPEDYKPLEDLCKTIVKDKQPFERLELTKAQLLQMFHYSVFKCRIINERVDTPTTTAYRCGPLIDLCLGPHVRHTGCIKAMTVTKNSAAYWEGKSDAESLQRVYGISFPDAKQLKEWKTAQEEAAKRDHRKIGLQQKLFFFHELSPGSCFFLPRGAHIYNTLMAFIRKEYMMRGFTEVVSPNMYNSKLWKISGHWDHYADNMFKIDIEKEIFGLKPMNCPGHCLMFAHELRSYKDMPFRFADFGVLHRNELSGALTGLTRVRRFQQDDAHIFCRDDQIKSEIRSCLDFLQFVYSKFGFSFKLFLSTRPEKFMGDINLWNRAEKQLEESLNEAGLKYELNPGDGAFYGPKIDITILDALKRSHQCATIQLDFQLPERFNLTYMGEDEVAHTADALAQVHVNKSADGDEEKATGSAHRISSEQLHRPVIIHRAILGSVERMIAILTESFAGKWPFWLSPMQVIIIPILSTCDEYAKKVALDLKSAGFQVDVDLDQGKTLNKKVRNSQLAQYNFILVVGEKEMANNTVNVRTRDNKVHGEHSVEHVLARFKEFQNTQILDAEEKF